MAQDVNVAIDTLGQQYSDKLNAGLTSERFVLEVQADRSEY